MGASAGRVLLISKGDWNAETTYTGLDWVRHNGAAWVCKNTCTNIEPTLENSDNWQIMARDGDGVTADTAMSDTSTNAVQNKVVKSYVDNSIAGISDMTGATAAQNGAHGLVPAPQAGDENKVLLGDGTWGAINDKFSFSDHDTSTSGTSFTDAEDGNMLVTDWTKNLLNPTLQTTTQNGVTCTNNGDGTYTLNGTATASANFFLQGNYGSQIPIINKVGRFKFVVTDSKDSTKVGVQLYHGETGLNIKSSIVTVTQDTLITLLNLQIKSGVTYNNVIVKPMLTTDLSATYDDFVPYSGYEIQTCGKNLLNPILQTTTQNGVTCTNNGDGTYTLNGTATKNVSFSITPTGGELINILIADKTYRLVGNSKNSGIRLALMQWDREWNYIDDSGYDLGEGINVKISTNAYHVRVNINIPSGVSCNNLVLKPMFTTDLSATYDDFEPYTGETITVTNDTEPPAFGLKSHKGITHIISPANVKCVYPTNESGKGVLDAMYNNELSKLKNAIFTYKTKEEYDTAVANDKIPDGATVIKDYDD